MAVPPQRDPRLERAEAWWAFLIRVALCVYGMYLVYGQAQAPNPPGAQLWIILAGIGCMGPAVAAPVAAVLEALRGTGGRGGDGTA